MITAPSSALLAVLLLPLLIVLGNRLGLVDKPGGRKQHQGDVPLVGGLAIYAALLATGLVAGAFVAPAAILFIALAGIVVAAGMVDDLRRLPAAAKLACQFAIAALAVGCGGPTIGAVGDPLGGFAFAWAAPLLSMLVYVAIMNAINLLDGADGVAGGVASVSLCALILLTALSGANRPDLASIELGAVIGFLFYNMPMRWRRRPRAFLGDAGSMLLGFSLAWLSLDLHAAAPHLPMAAFAWLLALPVIDMGRVAGRRILRGSSPFAAGRDHLHHLLIDRGVAPLRTALAMIAVSVGLAAIGVVGTILGVADGMLAAGFVIASLAYIAAVEIFLADKARAGAITAYVPEHAEKRPDRLRRAA